MKPTKLVKFIHSKRVNIVSAMIIDLFIIEFFGSTRIRFKISGDIEFRELKTGKRPTNSGINPNLIIDKKKLLIKLQILFPDENFKNVKERIKKKNIFVLKKNLLKIKLKSFVSWEINL